MGVLAALTLSLALPTLYEYYTGEGINSGLSADQSYFTLNDRNITIYSGAMHFFRVPKQLWRDRLRKMRAAGLNTVETYVPWNLHEPQSGYFDFGNGGSEMEDFVHIEEFLKTAQEEDLFVILRPGPYICAEWEFGGFPSWLLQQKDIKLRSSDPLYMGFVKRYFNELFPLLDNLQFTKGGPIIAVQVENEYGSTLSDTFKPDKEYVKEIRQLMLDNNIVELLVTSDSATGHGTDGTIPEYFLLTANFGGDPKNEFGRLQEIQPNRPSMAMEFYGGWFDHWGENHHTRDIKEVKNNLELILKYPGSFNMYMFHGGTSYGFMNGGNFDNGETDNSGYQPDTTSYDYDSPITEAGDYTEKYYMIKDLLEQYNNIPTKLPDLPILVPRIDYPNVTIQNQLTLKEIIDKEPLAFLNPNTMPMETLPINNRSGQSYGYIAYRKESIDLEANAVLKIEGRICDTALVMVNGNLISPPLNSLEDLNGFGTWKVKDSTINLTSEKLSGATLDIIIENWGRVGYGGVEQLEAQFKGIWQGNVLVNDKVIHDWINVPLEFKKSWTNNLSGWVGLKSLEGPSLFKATFNIDSVTDTFINMEEWTKGIVVVNGFVLGRYSRIGPQQTLYLPAPYLKEGDNEIVVFEHYKASDKIVFSTEPKFSNN